MGKAAVPLQEFLSAASQLASAMLSNAMYIEEQLPRLPLSAEVRSRILDVCSSLVGTKHDLVTEIYELDEMASSATLETIRLRVRRIVEWAMEDIGKMHQLVQSLDADPGNGVAFLLVAESATNILRAFESVSDWANRCLADVSG